MIQHQPIQWRTAWAVHKFNDPAALAEAGLNPEAVTWAELERAMRHGRLEPSEVIRRSGNLLMYGGASNLWECLIGNGTGTGSQTLTYFDNANAYLGVGDDATAAAATQTDLQASTNKVRVGMEASYPAHTDATTAGAEDIDFRSVFGSGVGNFAWEEWGIFNASTGGRMLNRKVESLGTKGSGSTWTLTVTISLS